MEITEFQSSLVNALLSLGYVEDIEIYQATSDSFRGRATVKLNYELRIRFKTYHSFLTLSFTLLYENNRIWGLDKDNRVGWHVHPLYNTSLHDSIEAKTIEEIIEIFDSVCSEFN